MLQKIKERLQMLGYSFTQPEEPAADPEENSEEQEEQTVPAETGDPEEETPTPDELQIQFIIEKTEAYIKNYCNISEVPEELEKSEIDMVAIEFLKEKALAGGLDTTSLRAEAVSSITEGDVTVSLASGSSISLPTIYGSIRARFESDLIPFRRMRW